MYRFLLFSLILFATFTATVRGAETTVRTFTPNSYSQLLNENDEKEFTLMFWSVECSPCLKELKHVSENKMYLSQKFIFVSIDNNQSPDQISMMIKKLKLTKQQHWVFQAGKEKEIIDSVDENWYGEVPRNYYFDEDHNRTRLGAIK